MAHTFHAQVYSIHYCFITQLIMKLKLIRVELSDSLMCNSQDYKSFDWVIIDKSRDNSLRKPDFESLKWNFYKN